MGSCYCLLFAQERERYGVRVRGQGTISEFRYLDCKASIGKPSLQSRINPALSQLQPSSGLRGVRETVGNGVRERISILASFIRRPSSTSGSRVKVPRLPVWRVSGPAPRRCHRCAIRVGLRSTIVAARCADTRPKPPQPAANLRGVEPRNPRDGRLPSRTVSLLRR